MPACGTGVHLMSLRERRRDRRAAPSPGRSTCSCRARSRASIGGIWAGAEAGYENVITLDVGGTSADIGARAARASCG